MRIQGNPGSPSAAAVPSAMSSGRLRVNSVARRLTPNQRRAIGMRRPFARPSSTLLCLDGRAAACRHRPAKERAYGY